MAKIEWVFQDESGTNLNRYIATNVNTGEKITFDLLRGGNVSIVGTPLNASNLNSLITAINENYDEIATLKTSVSTNATNISSINKDISSINTKISTIEKNVTNNQNDITAINSKIQNNVIFENYSSSGTTYLKEIVLEGDKVLVENTNYYIEFGDFYGNGLKVFGTTTFVPKLSFTPTGERTSYVYIPFLYDNVLGYSAETSMLASIKIVSSCTDGKITKTTITYTVFNCRRNEFIDLNEMLNDTLGIIRITKI